MKNTENTYKKFCPNVFVAKCQEQHEKGETITVETKYGKENEHIIHNLVGKTNDGFFLYSITRADGFNNQERARRKAERLNGYASNADKRSEEAYNTRATQNELEFLRLGEPIKVGHHSEKRHRKLFEKYDNKMRKSVTEAEKAEDYRNRAEYWEGLTNKVDLSMPESIEYFEYKLHKAKEKHAFYKNNPDKREHSFSLTYAKKAVNEADKNLKTAITLWGDEEEKQQIANEQREKAEDQASKRNGAQDLIKSYGGFFAFNNEQFREGYAKAKAAGFVDEGEKVTHVVGGLYIPSKTVQEYLTKSGLKK